MKKSYLFLVVFLGTLRCVFPMGKFESSSPSVWILPSSTQSSVQTRSETVSCESSFQNSPREELKKGYNCSGEKLEDYSGLKELERIFFDDGFEEQDSSKNSSRSEGTSYRDERGRDNEKQVMEDHLLSSAPSNDYQKWGQMRNDILTEEDYSEKKRGNGTQKKMKKSTTQFDLTDEDEIDNEVDERESFRDKKPNPNWMEIDWREINHPIRYWYRNQQLFRWQRQKGLKEELTKKMELEEFDFTAKWLEELYGEKTPQWKREEFVKKLDEKYKTKEVEKPGTTL